MNPFDGFVEGARKGFQIGTLHMLPALMAAFAIVEFLKISGLMDLIGQLLSPLMAPFGLPGEATAVLVCAWMTTAGALGLLASMVAGGIVDPTQMAVLLPAIPLMGSQIQLLGRILKVSGLETRYYPVCMAISLINAILAMAAMRCLIV